MGQGDSRSPRPLLEEPLLLHKKVKKKHRNTTHGLGALAMCLMIVNLCWGAILVTLYTKLSQKHHSHKTDPAIFWILRQLGEGDQLEEHPPSDPWWASRPTTPLDLPFAPSGPISPALQWVLLKLGQEEHLRHHNVSDKWWSHRPQTNITLNATNVSVTPMESYYHRHSRRLNEAYSSDEIGEKVRLFVKGRVRVGEYVEYYSQSKADYIKLIMAPESLRYVLKPIRNLMESTADTLPINTRFTLEKSITPIQKAFLDHHGFLIFNQFHINYIYFPFKFFAFGYTKVFYIFVIIVKLHSKILNVFLCYLICKKH